jgi:NAD-dependent dihydropyrimidine dehydrogenase PreA subunit
LLVHSINDDRCTGCDACVTVCPTDVLELVGNKSRVLRFDDCIQCEQCALVCPTVSLVMHYQGTAPPTLRMPDLDDFYQATPGLYLIGEAAGKPLVKNASNLGRAVIEHAVQSGLQSSSRAKPTPGVLDVLIVGSGPGGLSAALSCVEHGLTYAVLEKDDLVAATIARYPKGKNVMAEPYDVRTVGLLPVWDAGKDVGRGQRRAACRVAPPDR